MIGREDKKANDLFFTCSLIEYIARKTKNKRCDIVDALGKASIRKIYDLADVYHSDNIPSRLILLFNSLPPTDPFLKNDAYIFKFFYQPDINN